MSERIVFFLTTLSSEEERDEYEAWVRETDVPPARGLPSRWQTSRPTRALSVVSTPSTLPSSQGSSASSRACTAV